MNQLAVSTHLENCQFNGFFRRLTIILVLISVLTGFSMYIFGIANAGIMEDLGFTAVESGLIGSYNTIGMMISTIVFSMLADKIGAKKIVLLCVLLNSVFTGCTGLASSMGMFAFTRIASGCGIAVIPSVISLLSEYSPKKWRAVLCAIGGCGCAIGMMMAALSGMYILPLTEDWRTLFYLAFLGVLLLPLTVAFVPDSMSVLIAKGDNRRIEAVLKKADAKFVVVEGQSYALHSGVSANHRVSIVRLFQNGASRNTILACIIFCCNMAVLYGTGIWLPAMMGSAGFSVSSGFTLLFLFSLGSIVVSPLGGKLATKVGYKKVMAVLCLVTFLFLNLFGAAQSMLASSLLIFVAGASSNGTQAILQPYVASLYPEEIRTTGIGLATLFGRFGSFFAPLLGGFLVQNQVSLQMDFLVFASFSIVSCVCLLLTKPQKD